MISCMIRELGVSYLSRMHIKRRYMALLRRRSTQFVKSIGLGAHFQIAHSAMFPQVQPSVPWNLATCLASL